MDGQFNVDALKVQELDTPDTTTTSANTGGDASQTAATQPDNDSTTTGAQTDTLEKPQVTTTTSELSDNNNGSTNDTANKGSADTTTTTDVVTKTTTGEGTAAPAPAATPQVDAINVAKAEAQSEFLKSLGVTSMEELQEKLKPKVEETEEQKAQRQNQYVADVDNYAVKKNLMSKDEIVTLETLKKTPASQIVFNEFAKDFKAKNAEATDELVQQNFRLAYNLDSENAALKAHGEALIQQQADSVIKNLDSKYQQAKADFDSESANRQQIPAFKNFIKGSLEQFVPKQMSLVTDGDSNVVLDLDANLRADVEKFIVDNTTFDEFKKLGNSQQMSDLLKARIEGYVLVKNIDSIKKTIYEAGKAAGLKSGSAVGATAPFPITNGNAAIPVSTEGIKPEDDAKLNRLFG